MQSSISPVGTCRIRYAAMAEAAGVADEKSISFASAFRALSNCLGNFSRKSSCIITAQASDDLYNYSVPATYLLSSASNWTRHLHSLDPLGARWSRLK
jgi:hypothetical protein